MEDSGEFIQKMMELGIGLSIVQHMPTMMNGVFAAGNNATSAPPPVMGTYVAIGGKQAGPFTDNEMQRMVQGNIVNADTLVWGSGNATMEKSRGSTRSEQNDTIKNQLKL